MGRGQGGGLGKKTLAGVKALLDDKGRVWQANEKSENGIPSRKKKPGGGGGNRREAGGKVRQRGWEVLYSPTGCKKGSGSWWGVKPREEIKRYTTNFGHDLVKGQRLPARSVKK